MPDDGRPSQSLDAVVVASRPEDVPVRRPAWRRWLDGERVAAVILLVLSVVFLRMSLDLGVTEDNQAAPGAFPTLVTGALVVFSVLWLVAPRRRTADGDGVPAALAGALTSSEGVPPPSTGAAGAADGDVAASGGFASDSKPARLIFVLAWTAVTIPFTERIGMIPLLFVYLNGLLLVVARASLWKSLLGTAIGLLLAAYGAYEAGIFLPDPLGLGQFLVDTVDAILGR